MLLQSKLHILIWISRKRAIAFGVTFLIILASALMISPVIAAAPHLSGIRSIAKNSDLSVTANHGVKNLINYYVDIFIMDKVFKITARSDNAESLHELIRGENLDIGCTGGITLKDKKFSIDIYASEKELTKLKEKILAKELSNKIFLDITDITEHLSDRLKEVGTGNKYEVGEEVPHGLGKKVKQ